MQFFKQPPLELSRITALLGVHKMIPNIRKEMEDLILFQLDTQQSPKTTEDVSGTLPASFFHAEKPLSQNPHFLHRGSDGPSSHSLQTTEDGQGWVTREHAKSFPLVGLYSETKTTSSAGMNGGSLCYVAQIQILLRVSL